jgi:hypothetical protein
MIHPTFIIIAQFWCSLPIQGWVISRSVQDANSTLPSTDFLVHPIPQCVFLAQKKRRLEPLNKNAHREKTGAPTPDSDDEEPPMHTPPSEIKLHNFLTFLGQQKDSVSIEANIGI